MANVDGFCIAFKSITSIQLLSHDPRFSYLSLSLSLLVTVTPIILSPRVDRSLTSLILTRRNARLARIKSFSPPM